MSTVATGLTSYAPHRSHVVGGDLTPSASSLPDVVAPVFGVGGGDGDVWQERLAVCEGASADGKPKLLIRSYYCSMQTNERVWDEPPSGASKVNHATPEMRRLAQVQLEDLQSTLAMIPPDDEEHIYQVSSSSKKSNNKKGFFRRFRLKADNKKEQKQKPRPADPSKDLNLQRAIVRSMQDQGGRDVGGSKQNRTHRIPNKNGFVHPHANEEDDPDIALAKALSMSEQQNNNNNNNSVGLHESMIPTSELNEEEMIRQALEASRLDVIHEPIFAAAKTAGAACIEKKSNSFVDDDGYDDSSMNSSDQPAQPRVFKQDPNERYD